MGKKIFLSTISKPPHEHHLRLRRQFPDLGYAFLDALHDASENLYGTGIAYGTGLGVKEYLIQVFTTPTRARNFIDLRK